MNRLKIGLPTLLLILFLNSCGYYWEEEDSKTISIPYICGDTDGSLTAEVIRTFSCGSHFVVKDQGKYRLEVSLVQVQNETIGYRVDPQKVHGKVRKDILADQGRKMVSADITLYQEDRELPLFGPQRIRTSVDYDYVDGDSFQDLTFELDGKQQTVLAFSLGQLESIEAAQEAANRPLYRQLSQKIVDLITAYW